MRVVPSAKAAATARIGYSSIIDGRARRPARRRPSGGSPAPAGRRRVSPPSSRSFRRSISAPISSSVVRRPGAQRVHHHALDHDVRARHDQRGDEREGGRGRVGRARRPSAPRSSGWPCRVIARPSAPCGSTVDLGAEMAQHALGVVARRLALDHRGAAGRVEAGEQHRGLDLGGGGRGLVGDRDGLARARAASAARARPRPRSRTVTPMCASGSRMRRIGRLRREASPSKVAVIGWLPATPIISREPGAGIAEIEHRRRARRARRCRRRAPASGPAPRGRSRAPSARQASAVRSTSSPSSRPSIRVSPIGEQAEDQGAVRDRLVAGDAQAPLAGRPPAVPATGDAGLLSCDIRCSSARS